jgi:hypothetical protein
MRTDRRTTSTCPDRADADIGAAANAAPAQQGDFASERYAPFNGGSA